MGTKLVLMIWLLLGQGIVLDTELLLEQQDLALVLGVWENYQELLMQDCQKLLVLVIQDKYLEEQEISLEEGSVGVSEIELLGTFKMLEIEESQLEHLLKISNDNSINNNLQG